MRITPLTWMELEACVDIVADNYGPKLAKAAKQEIMQFDNHLDYDSPIRPSFMIAKQRKTVVGFAGYAPSWMDYGIYEVFWVNVTPILQRTGIGTKLMHAVITAIRGLPKSKAIVLSTSLERYYEGFGFETVTKIGKSCIMRLEL